MILDIRTPKEYAEGHIPDAINIDYKADSFQSELEKLDRDTTYLMHCRSGRRSANSLEIFEKLGFRHVIHMDDGILGWQEDLVK
jgi:phage shock protein E